MLSLVSARLAATFAATEHHHIWTSKKLYCLMTEARVCVSTTCPESLHDCELNPQPLNH